MSATKPKTGERKKAVARKPAKKTTRERGWRKAIQVAAARRGQQTLVRAVKSPNLVDSYLAGFLADDSEPDSNAAAIVHFRNGTQTELSTSRIAWWRGGKRPIPDAIVLFMLPIAVRWAFKSRWSVAVSERDSQWIADRLYPSVVAGGVFLGELIGVAFAERIGARSLSAGDVRWTARALLQGRA